MIQIHDCEAMEKARTDAMEQLKSAKKFLLFFADDDSEGRTYTRMTFGNMHDHDIAFTSKHLDLFLFQKLQMQVKNPGTPEPPKP